jgi:hypothetical protein
MSEWFMIWLEHVDRRMALALVRATSPCMGTKRVQGQGIILSNCLLSSLTYQGEHSVKGFISGLAR